jgi:glycosyltransferase involved in cell wall biosynthesis
MLRTPALPPLLVAFYGNPDHYPPTYNAVSLLRARFRVTVISRRSEREVRTWPEDVRLQRVGPGRSTADIDALGAAGKVADFGAFVAALRRELRASAPRVVYAYEPHALVALALAGCRAPIVFQRHEVEDLVAPRPWRRRSFGDWVYRASYRLSRRVAILVFPEQNRADYYARLLPGVPRPVVVPNFPLLRGFPRPDWDEVLPGRLARRQVLYRGSLGGANGLRQVVLTLSHLAPPATLRLAGTASPEFQRELEQLAADEGTRDRIDFAGFVPFERLNRESQGAAVGLLLYQAVHLNWTYAVSAHNKLYEYAACGLPAVVPDRPSYRAFLAGETWVEFADETDPRAVAAAVERVLADPAAYEARCRAARRAFEERFNYEIAFAPLLERIVALAEGRRP